MRVERDESKAGPTILVIVNQLEKLEKKTFTFADSDRKYAYHYRDNNNYVYIIIDSQVTTLTALHSKKAK